MGPAVRCVILSIWSVASVAAQAPYTIHTFAGGDFPNGSVATQVSGGYVTGLALDLSGNLFIASGSQVNKVTADGSISIYARSLLGLGMGLAADNLGNLYAKGGQLGTVVKIDTTGKLLRVLDLFNVGLMPTLVVPDFFGNLYIAGTYFAFRIDPNGYFFLLPIVPYGSFTPSGLAVDRSGNVYVSDRYGYPRVWKMDSSQNVTVFAGTGYYGSTGDGGLATQATLENPQALATDAVGNVYISTDSGVRKVDTSGIISTVLTPPQNYFPGYIAVDSAGANLYVSYNGNSVYRDKNGTVSLVAGVSHSGDGGPATSAQFDYPQGMLLDASGNVLIGDVDGSVRKVDQQGIISSAITPVIDPNTGFPTPNSVRSVAYDSVGNLVIADGGGSRILSYTPSGAVSTIVGKDYVAGNSGDGGPAIQSELNSPQSVIFDQLGNLVISDRGNHNIRKVDKNGIITTIAGTGTGGYGGDGGPATKAQLYFPGQIALDSAGNLYIADTNNFRVRKIDLGGIITTVAGNGQTGGPQGEGGLATSVSLNYPAGVAFDAKGNLLIGQIGSVRQVDSYGIITTIAGGGTLPVTDGIPATDAGLVVQTLLVGSPAQFTCPVLTLTRPESTSWRQAPRRFLPPRSPSIPRLRASPLPSAVTNVPRDPTWRPKCLHSPTRILAQSFSIRRTPVHSVVGTSSPRGLTDQP